MSGFWNLCSHGEVCGPVDANGCQVCVKCGAAVCVRLTERAFVLAMNEAYRTFGIEKEWEVPPDGLLEDEA
jgi:hypothetical protein